MITLHRFHFLRLCLEPAGWAIAAMALAILTVRLVGDVASAHGAYLTAFVLQLEVGTLALLASRRLPRRSLRWRRHLAQAVARAGGPAFPRSHIEEPSGWARGETTASSRRITLSQMQDEFMAAPGRHARRLLGGVLLTVVLFSQGLVWAGPAVQAASTVALAGLVISTAFAAGSLAWLQRGSGEPPAWTPARRTPAILSVPLLGLVAAIVVVAEAVVFAPDLTAAFERAGFWFAAVAALWALRTNLDGSAMLRVERLTDRLKLQWLAGIAYQGAWLVARGLSGICGWTALAGLPLGLAMTPTRPALGFVVLQLACTLAGLHFALGAFTRNVRFPRGARVVGVREVRAGLVGTRLERRITVVVNGGLVVLSVVVALHSLAG